MLTCGGANCGGGGEYVKNGARIAVGFASSEASSPTIRKNPPLGLSRKILFLTGSALIFCATLALPQSAKAEGSLTVAGIQTALRGDIQTTPQVADDAGSALSGFAEQIGTPAANTDRKFDDQAFAALRDFAQRLGSVQPQSTKDLPKVAEARSLLEFLQQGSAPQSAPAMAPSPAKGATAARVEATYVDGKVCLTCHASQAAAFEKTVMGRIGKTKKGMFECQNCHGPGSAHVKAGGGRGVGGILSFGETDPRSTKEKNAICLACHEKGDRTYWDGSTHQTRGLACTSCHTIMKEVSRKHQLRTAFEPDTCFQCHKDRRAQMFRSSHMPLREGKIVCSDCHNPHGSQTAGLLRADSINDNCYKCHAEKRGPFLFEHTPVRENCVNCHDPHGSVNEYSLKISRPRLCTECHGFGHGTNSGPLVVQAISRACQNCHTEVHGTNSPSGALLHR